VEKIPGAKLKVFESGGHFVYMAYPDEFNAVIRKFIEENDS
jgi:pimeloyl-ACP methyl ester carboxylesterase